jgi:hypothetical protein
LAEREKKPQRVLKRQKQTTYAVRRLSKAWRQGCQMVCFHAKNPDS